MTPTLLSALSVDNHFWKKGKKREVKMSGCSYSTDCPICGGNLVTYSDYKPHDNVSGICLECGLEYRTVDSQLTLEEVNEERVNYDLFPLWELKTKKEV